MRGRGSSVWTGRSASFFFFLTASPLRPLLHIINSSTLNVSLSRHVSRTHRQAPLLSRCHYPTFHWEDHRSHPRALTDVESDQFILLLINSRSKCNASFWKNMNPDAEMTSIRNTALCKGKGLVPHRGAAVCASAFCKHCGNVSRAPSGGRVGSFCLLRTACAGVGRRGSVACLMLFVKVNYLLL